MSALLAAVAALLLDSCGDPGGGPSIPPSPPASILSPTPSPTPRVTPTTVPADKAKGAVVRFWSVVDELAADPDKSLNALHDVARDRMFDQWTFNIREYRYKQLRQVGHVKVGNATVMAADGTDRNRVSVCLDASKTDLLDRSGKSVVEKDRPARVAYRYTVQVDGAKGYLIDEAVIGTC